MLFVYKFFNFKAPFFGHAKYKNFSNDCFKAPNINMFLKKFSLCVSLLGFLFFSFLFPSVKKADAGEGKTYSKTLSSAVRLTQGPFAFYERVKLPTDHTLPTDKGKELKKAYDNYKNNLLDEAEKGFFKILGSYEVLGDYTHFFLARIQMKKYSYRVSVSLLKHLLKIYPESLLFRQAIWDLGKCYYALEDFPKAMDVYKRILDKYPNNRDIPRINYRMAVIYEKWEDWQSAVDKYKELLIDYPDSTFSFIAEKRLKLLKDKPDIIFTLGEDDFYNRALLLGGSRFWAFAISELEIFIQNFSNSPHLPSALYNIGRIYERKRLREKAIEAYQAVFQRFPDNPLAMKSLYRIGRIAWNQNKEKQVINVYEQVLEKYKPEAAIISKIYFVLGRIYEKRHNFEKASFYYRKVLEQFSENPERGLWKAGWVHYLWGKNDVALDFFERLGKFKGYWGIRGRYWAAKLAQERGNLDKSIALLNSIWNTLPLSYYGVLSSLRLKNMGVRVELSLADKEKKDMSFLDTLTSDAYFHMVRVFELCKLGLFKESIRELKYCEKLISAPSFFLLESRLMRKMGNKLKAILAVSKNKKPLVKQVGKKLIREDLEIVFPLEYKDLIWRYSGKVSPWFVTSIIRQESVFNPLSVSHANAYGLMQIIPPTGMALAAKLNFDKFSVKVLFDPEKNIMMGIRFLVDLIEDYDGSLIMAAAHYNAGPVVKKWWKNRFSEDPEAFVESIPYKETRNYIKLIIRNYFSYQFLYADTVIPFSMKMPFMHKPRG